MNPFIDKITKNWQSIGLESVLEQLLIFHRNAKGNFDFYGCNDMICECLIALKKYQEFLDFSNPKRIYFINDLQNINLRLSIQKKIGLEANPIDVYRTQFPIQSKIVKSHPKQFEKKYFRYFYFVCQR